MKFSGILKSMKKLYCQCSVRFYDTFTFTTLLFIVTIESVFPYQNFTSLINQNTTVTRIAIVKVGHLQVPLVYFETILLWIDNGLVDTLTEKAHDYTVQNVNLISRLRSIVTDIYHGDVCHLPIYYYFVNVNGNFFGCTSLSNYFYVNVNFHRISFTNHGGTYTLNGFFLVYVDLDSWKTDSSFLEKILWPIHEVINYANCSYVALSKVD